MTSAAVQGATLFSASSAPTQPGWTGPSDRDAVAHAVHTLYEAASLPAPPIIWAQSPVSLARQWKMKRLVVGDGVRASIFDGPAHRLLGALRRAERGAFPPRSAFADLTALLAHEGQRARIGAVARLKLLARVIVGLRHRRTWQSFRALSVSPYDCAWVREAKGFAGLAPEDRAIGDAIATLVGNVGWILPCTLACWLSERPVTLALDDRGRLHCKDGPALAYADGWRRFAWKGIEVPSAFIQHPERITLNAIDSQTDIFVRRCLIEMVTPKRFIHMGGADLIMRDETGTLWRRTWPRGDGWAAVEVINGTPGPDGQLERYVLQVPPELETARAAVAWTYGMTEQQYRSLVRRT